MRKKTYKTAKGKTIEIDFHAGENDIAMGNLAGKGIANARGDILGKGSKNIVQKRSEKVRKFYREELPVVEKNFDISDNPVPLKKEEPVKKVSKKRESKKH